MRVLLAIGLLVLLVPASAPTASPGPVRTAIFYYPWYGTAGRDGWYRHWDALGHDPPGDIASNYYPARGPYSSSSPTILNEQMRDIAQAGIDEIVSSWWGSGSREDKRLPAVIKAAQAVSLQVAVHIEPYPGRTVASVTDDVAHLRQLGISDFYVYRASDYPPEEWAAMNAALTGVRVFAQTNLPGFAAAGRFTGLYTYDILQYGASTFTRLCAEARRLRLVCAPSVGPGYLAAALGDVRVKPRSYGATYDAMWRSAVAAGADEVTITSYNEWGEGTQIEPARQRVDYVSYDGAYGLHGLAARRAYLDRTAFWTARLRELR
jgi:hypothetical protein